MACRKVCLAYKARRQLHGSYYGAGSKRCNECELFLKWSGSKCPCCKKTLRTRPHNTRLKARLRHL
ncbi:MAG: hypothetical protein E6K92_02445 [Thaumarchaeota archaeon]|nr:MAG: hypothetical protein E6K92_02445 [Nitrososphaerota archaeon]